MEGCVLEQTRRASLDTVVFSAWPRLFTRHRTPPEPVVNGQSLGLFGLLSGVSIPLARSSSSVYRLGAGTADAEPPRAAGCATRTESRRKYAGNTVVAFGAPAQLPASPMAPYHESFEMVLWGVFFDPVQNLETYSVCRQLAHIGR